MADETSHTFLQKVAPAPQAPAPTTPSRDKYFESFVDFAADKDLREAAHNRNEIASFAKEPWRTEIHEAHQRDLELHRETQAMQRRIKAAGAPHILVALAGENTEVRDYLIGLMAARGLEGK
ncbi:hypothetical protein [Mesorhizobium sp. M1273]|uniref:hypothetical protein n=1 Tax=Mesorhizobium sp. M1273 TaxID=2957075 RepID=UPI00333D374D